MAPTTSRAQRLIMGSLYSDIPSWLHRVPAGLKLALLVLLGLVLFWVKDPLILGIIAGLALALWLSLGRATRPARRLLFSVLVAAGLVALPRLSHRASARPAMYPRISGSITQ